MALNLEMVIRDLVAFAAASGEKFSGIISVKIDENSWRIRLGPKASVLNDPGESECTLELSRELLEDLRAGIKNPQSAFPAGEIQVRGDIQMVLRDWELFEVLFSNAIC